MVALRFCKFYFVQSVYLKFVLQYEILRVLITDFVGWNEDNCSELSSNKNLNKILSNLGEQHRVVAKGLDFGF